MGHEFEKNLGILTHINELGGQEFRFEMQHGAESTRCHIKAKLEDAAVQYKQLRDALAPRQPEVEQAYGQLCGSGQQLNLAGMMLDNVIVDADQSHVQVFCERNA